MTNTTSILNWNMRGYFKNINELQVLTNEFNPTYICIQETKLKTNNINFKNYNTFNKNKTCSQDIMASGGVMTLVDKNIHSVSYQIDTNLQAIAVHVTFPLDFILCNVYIDHGISNQTFKDELEKLIKQLGHSFIITGDFNSHNILWGSHKTDKRGTIITELTDEYSLTILNEKLPTHIADCNGRLTAIDLTICTQNIIHFTEWTVLDDLHSSDHFPILISFPFTNY
jgi:exonuclease III